MAFGLMKKTWDTYYNPSDLTGSAQRMVVNLSQITKFATNTLMRIKEKTGYTLEETVQMMKN